MIVKEVHSSYCCYSQNLPSPWNFCCQNPPNSKGFTTLTPKSPGLPARGRLKSTAVGKHSRLGSFRWGTGLMLEAGSRWWKLTQRKGQKARLANHGQQHEKKKKSSSQKWPGQPAINNVSLLPLSHTHQEWGTLTSSLTPVLGLWFGNCPPTTFGWAAS